MLRLVAHRLVREADGGQHDARPAHGRHADGRDRHVGVRIVPARHVEAHVLPLRVRALPGRARDAAVHRVLVAARVRLVRDAPPEADLVSAAHVDALRGAVGVADVVGADHRAARRAVRHGVHEVDAAGLEGVHRDGDLGGAALGSGVQPHHGAAGVGGRFDHVELDGAEAAPARRQVAHVVLALVRPGGHALCGAVAQADVGERAQVQVAERGVRLQAAPRAGAGRAGAIGPGSRSARRQTRSRMSVP